MFIIVHVTYVQVSGTVAKLQYQRPPGAGLCQMVIMMLAATQRAKFQGVVPL